ncbi:hypothetical protein [uncultured Methanobrevibacter sp.]|uniref:hypothetical protein n=1 Tax=uncultured Methanobrevibacter sp. TaxID=253161 RepID=UPI0025EA1772|nr:hypothetical protein [uncultured Methanobrevibacter sp.]
MNKALKGILIIILFIGFFEAGLLSSYTIVTSQVPDVKGLIDLQFDTIGNIFSQENFNSVVIKDPSTINVTNKEDFVSTLKEQAGVDDIDYNNLTIATYNDDDEDVIDLNITAYGYSAPTSSSVISSTPDYKIIATGTANETYDGYKVNLDSITIVSIFKIYDSDAVDVGNNQNNNTTETYSY